MTSLFINKSRVIDLVAFLTELDVFLTFEVSNNRSDVCDVVKMVTDLKEVQMLLIHRSGRIMVAEARDNVADIEHVNVHIKVIRCNFNVFP